MSRAFERAGWVGISVSAEIATSHDVRKGWLAVANDPEDGAPGVSAWANNRREAAFWVSPDGARNLALSLLALAERAESS